MEEMLKLILDKLNSMDSRMESMERRMDSMEQQMERKFNQLEVTLQEINQDVKDIKQQVTIDNNYYDKKIIAFEKEFFRINDILESKGLV